MTNSGNAQKRYRESTVSLWERLDSMPLWGMGILLGIIVFSTYIFRGDKSAFYWNDQLDDMLTYVLTARHWGEGLSVFPEMMTGIGANDMLPFAILFLPLYVIFPARVAFTIQYAILFAIAFGGMYACVREITGSGVLAVVSAGVFAMLPFYPVYGAATAGIPMIFYAILCAYKKKNLLISYILIVVFATTAHAVFSGYSVMGLWGIFLLICAFRKKLNKESVIAYAELFFAYAIVNLRLILEFLGGSSGTVSHRSEFVSHGEPFIDSFLYVLTNNAQHADSMQKYLFLPLVILLMLGIIFRDREDGAYGEKLIWAISGFSMIILVALLYAFFKSNIYINWSNQRTGILHFFNMYRFIWLAPGLWWFELAMVLNLWWRRTLWNRKYLLGVICILFAVLPSFKYICSSSYFYNNIIYKDNTFTGFLSWESYYAEDVMEDIEQAIGEDMSNYRVAHIGMSPTPALMHGFYTIDGYAGSYDVEYKHRIRNIISKELEKADAGTKQYFDEWGSRCYLFNSQSGNSFMNWKYSMLQYKGLEYDWDALKELGCRYIFSCGEIVDCKKCGLSLVDTFSSDTSFWTVWVYKFD